MDDELKDLFFGAIEHFPLERRDAAQRWLKRRLSSLPLSSPPEQTQRGRTTFRRFACNRSKKDRGDSPALLSGLGSQELRGIYRLIQITTLIAINADLKISIIEFNPKLQFFGGIDG